MQRRKRADESSIVSIDPYGRVPPKAIELEKAILGAILLEAGAFGRASDIIGHESFYEDAHQLVFKAMESLKLKHRPIDTFTVAQELISKGELDIIGGPYFLTTLTNGVVSGANIEHHAAYVQQKFMRRELIRISSKIYGMAYDDEIDEFDLIEEAEKSILEIGTKNSNSTMIQIDDAIVKGLHQIEEWRKVDSTLTGVPSGYPKIDKATRGWQPSNFIVLAARPSVGKTAFALNLVRNAALNKEKPTAVAVWSLEMGVVDLVLRMMASESEVLLYKIQTGKLTDGDMTLIHQRVAELSKSQIYFNDDDYVTIRSFCAQARRLKKKHNIGLILVDYLQLMSGEKEGGNREQEISKISRTFKRMSRELNIPIIALSQLSREVEKRKDGKKTPMLSDLRESGAIEQDADVVMFLYGPSEEEIQADANLEGERYLKVAKQRNGVLVTEKFNFKSEIQLFEAIHDITGRSGNWQPVPPNNFYEPKKVQDQDEEPLF